MNREILSERKEMKPKTKRDELTIEAAAEQVAQLQARADAAEAELTEAKRRADKAEGEAESLRTRVDEFEQQKQDEASPDKLNATIKALTMKIQTLEKQLLRRDSEDPVILSNRVKTRVKVEAAAAALLGHSFVTDSLSDRDIMVAVVEKLHNQVIPDDRSDDYVQARFDAAVEGYMANEEAKNQLRAVADNKIATQVVHHDSRTAHAAMVERNRNAWKTKQN